jgi:hypothetical protein
MIGEGVGNRALRAVPGLTGRAVTGKCKRLHYKGFHNLNPTYNIIIVINSRTI